MAKLTFRFGAMNCGKTALLLQSAYKYESMGMSILILKPYIDTKGDNKIVSRTGLSKEVDHLIKPHENLYNYLIKHTDNIKCIFVDEAQFLSRKQIDDLMRITNTKDIPVICYGLRTDFKTNGFKGSIRLLEIADNLEEIKTLCRCGGYATLNARVVNDNLSLTGKQVEIDNNDNITYIPLCSKCYQEIKEETYIETSI